MKHKENKIKLPSQVEPTGVGGGRIFSSSENKVPSPLSENFSKRDVCYDCGCDLPPSETQYIASWHENGKRKLRGWCIPCGRKAQRGSLSDFCTDTECPICVDSDYMEKVAKRSGKYSAMTFSATPEEEHY